MFLDTYAVLSFFLTSKKMDVSYSFYWKFWLLNTETAYECRLTEMNSKEYLEHHAAALEVNNSHEDVNEDKTVQAWCRKKMRKCS